MRFKMSGAALTLCCFLSGTALAHHSYGMFDRAKEQTVSGVVDEFQWTNPHARLIIWIADAKGSLDKWTIEIGPPGQLVRTGWKRNSIKPGDKVAVLINPLNDGSPGGRLLMVTMPDGSKLYDVVFKSPDGRASGGGIGAEVKP